MSKAIVLVAAIAMSIAAVFLVIRISPSCSEKQRVVIGGSWILGERCK